MPNVPKGGTRKGSRKGFRKAVAPDGKPRMCLRCLRAFKSTWIGNRMCKNCLAVVVCEAA